MGDTGCDIVVCIPCVVTTTRTCDVRRLEGGVTLNDEARDIASLDAAATPPQSHCRRSGKAVI